MARDGFRSTGIEEIEVIAYERRRLGHDRHDIAVVEGIAIFSVEDCSLSEASTAVETCRLL